MIFETIFNILISTLMGLISLMPSIPMQDASIGALFNIMGFGVYIVGGVTFTFMISSVVAWTGVHLTYAVIEWIYKKIPGIS